MHVQECGWSAVQVDDCQIPDDPTARSARLGQRLTNEPRCQDGYAGR